MTAEHMTPRPLGPFWSVQQVVKASVRVPGRSSSPERTAFITAALDTARIGVGDYDRAIARWLAMWESETVATVLDWIARAFDAGVTSGAEVFSLTVSLDRVPTDAEVDALHAAGLTDADVDYGATGSSIHVDRVAYSRDEAVGTIADQAAAAGFLVADVEDTTDEAEVLDGYLHALPPIDFPGRVAGVEPGPRCGVEGRTALFAADVTCPACLADMAQDGGQR